MAEKTAIAWTNRTWNPWRGCTKISPGCKNCYMFTAQERYGQDPTKVVRTKTWGQPARWQREAEAAGRLEMVFTCSWSDWFHEVADQWRDEAWAVVKACPNLQFQILTKRADRIADHLPADWGDGYQNAWLGVSVEDQKRANERVPLLMKSPAVVRFISAEPLLGPVVLNEITTGPDDGAGWTYRHWDALSGTNWCDCHDVIHPNGTGPVDWVIVGGESGPGYRPMDHAWARSIRDQCRAAGAAFFFKQSAAPRTEMGIELDGQVVREYPTPRILV